MRRASAESTSASASAKTVDSTRGYIHGPGAEYGVTKVVVDAGSGVVLGASTMGPGAGELVGIFLLAVRERMTADGAARV